MTDITVLNKIIIMLYIYFVGGPHVQLAVVGTCLIVKNIGLYFCNLHSSYSGYVFTLILYYLGFIIGKIK